MASSVQEFDFSKQGVTVEDTFSRLYKDGYFDEVQNKYHDPATEYAFRVLSGKQLAGQKIKLAMFRHLNDLVRAGNDDFPYMYNLGAVKSIINFSKLCPDVEIGSPKALLEWQQAVLCLINGWRSKAGTKEKRFTYVYLSVARTNGKTYLVNILLTYAYLIENAGKKNLDFAYVGTNDKISKKGMRYLSSTLDYLGQNLQPFKKLIDSQQIQSSADLIQSFSTKSQILRLTAGSGKFDSLHATLAVLDEYGDPQYSDGVISRMTSGSIHQLNKQLIVTSSAYESPNVPMHRDYQRLSEVIQKDNQREADDSLFLCWEQDSLEETEQLDTWVKSNPLLDLPSMHDRLMLGLKSEKDKQEVAGRISWFQNRNLNMWLQTAKNHYLEVDDVQNSIITDFNMDNRDCYVGFDLSHVSDDTSFSFVFPYIKDGRKMYHLYQHSFVPLARSNNNLLTKEKTDGIQYGTAAKKGYATIADNPQGLINEDSVGRWFLDFVHAHNLTVKSFVYDPYQAGPMTDWLNQNMDEVPFITLRQGSLSLNQPTVFLRNQFISGNITMLDDEILQAACTNAVTVTNAYGIKIDKEAMSKKIDCLDAIIDAISEAAFYFSNPMHGQKEDKSNPFDGMSENDVNNYFNNEFSF
ncbi:terminase TerL endonuclease subunit [Levilactobacillus brevis]